MDAELMADDADDDPTYRSAVREAAFVLILWAICFVWSVGYSYLRGYVPYTATTETSAQAPLLETPFGLGIPDWAFWGVLIPWGGCILVSLWFALGWMKDEDAPAVDDEVTS